MVELLLPILTVPSSMLGCTSGEIKVIIELKLGDLGRYCILRILNVEIVNRLRMDIVEYVTITVDNHC